MDDIRPDQSLGPEIAVRQVSAERCERVGSWNIGWLLRNRALQPLRILAVRLPHGQFKAEPSVFEPAIYLEAAAEREFLTIVHCHETPGLVTENAFLIFYVIWNAQEWRIFVRVRVVAASDGIPHATPESITTQSVGFSENDV